MHNESFLLVFSGDGALMRLPRNSVPRIATMDQVLVAALRDGNKDLWAFSFLALFHAAPHFQVSQRAYERAVLVPRF